MSGYLYALEKLAAAVHCLAVGPGDVRSRLWDAFLSFHPLTEDDLPAELRPDYRWVLHELTKREPQYQVWCSPSQSLVMEGRVPANLRRMRNSTGSKIAERICAMYWRLEGICDAEFADTRSASRSLADAMVPVASEGDGEGQ